MTEMMTFRSDRPDVSSDGYSLVVLIGKIVDMEELRETRSGVPVLNLRIAFKKQRDGKNNGEIITARICVFHNVAKKCATAIKEGDTVTIQGELVQNVPPAHGVPVLEVKAHMIKALPRVRFPFKSIMK
jgi:primosomal replication protein N